MAYYKALTTEEKVKIVEALQRGNLSHRDIAKQFNRSQATISKLAKEAGINPTYRRKRSSAVGDVEGTYSREERVAVADKALAALENLISSGGLNPKEMREATQALKATLEARRREDLPEPDEGQRAATEGSYIALASCAKSGMPRNVSVYFSILDVQEALEKGDEEALEEAKERVVAACRAAGLYGGPVPFDEMIEAANRTFSSPYAGYDSSAGERAAGQGQENGSA